MTIHLTVWTLVALGVPGFTLLFNITRPNQAAGWGPDGPAVLFILSLGFGVGVAFRCAFIP